MIREMFFGDSPLLVFAKRGGSTAIRNYPAEKLVEDFEEMVSSYNSKKSKEDFALKKLKELISICGSNPDVTIKQLKEKHNF